jgi:outer membrane cobalamin receptor
LFFRGEENMKTKTALPRRHRLAVAVGLASAVSPPLLYLAAARAQEPTEEITVTGSRIARETGFTTATPVTAVTTADLAGFKPGATMVDQLAQLPQFYQTQTAQNGGGALFGGAGRSVIDLRAMGPQRTLVLLDGSRLAPADRDGSVHIDNIPTALLSQVEVVNATNEDPPIIPVFDQRFSAQSNPVGFNSYDVYGRRYLLNFTYKL